MLYCITKCILFFIFNFFFRIKIQGKENIPRSGAFILASNHSSFLDPPILSVGSFRRRLNFLAKEELFFNNIFGWYIRKLGAIPLSREKTDISAIKECIKRIKRGQPIVIFPEGTRNRQGEIKEGLPGIALLAAKTNIPVIPAYIKGADCALDANLKSLRFCRIYLKFGKPLMFYRQGPQTYSDILQRIMSAIEELSD